MIGDSGREGCLAAKIFELNYSEIYDFTQTINIHVIHDEIHVQN